MNVGIYKTHPEAVIPAYQTAGAAGFDLHLVEDVVIPARGLAKARTGLVFQVPEGHVLLIVSRSSNPQKRGIDMANSVGVIDSDYCGPEDEVFLVLQNLTDAEVRIDKGERVAQGLIVPFLRAQFEERTKNTADSRGGFGSTGMN